MPRPTMVQLISRLRSLCNGDTTLTDDDYQAMLDDHAVMVNAPLQPLDDPVFTRFQAPYGWYEDGATVAVSTAALATPADYTFDALRGIVTMPRSDARPLVIRGTAYNLYAAAGAAWDLIAARYALQFDFSSIEGSYKLGQQMAACQSMAAHYRARAWATSGIVERSDTPPLAGSGDWHNTGYYRTSESAI